jgi:hypothetical protein
MILKIILSFMTSLTLALIGPVAVHAAGADALFATDSTLHVTVTAPFKQIMKERPEDEYVAGTLETVNADGTILSLDIGIRTRGIFRRNSKICPFAPLRVNFQKKQLDDTVFDKQDKLKLVTHCRSKSNRYDQSVISEYLAYRILNLMTESSFRVRLMRVTYVHADDRNKREENYAFFIEHKDRLAKRLDLTEIEAPKIGMSMIQAEYGNLVSVFQYLIGNTDFSPISGPPDEMCCHNHVLFGGENTRYWSMPYDFDQAGIVNSPHSQANPRFKLRSVRQRLYRGRCLNNQILPDSLDQYRAKRSDIEALINQQSGLDKGTRSSILSFVESFYETIDNDKRVQSQLVKACI